MHLFSLFPFCSVHGEGSFRLSRAFFVCSSFPYLLNSGVSYKSGSRFYFQSWLFVNTKTKKFGVGWSWFQRGGHYSFLGMFLMVRSQFCDAGSAMDIFWVNGMGGL